MHNNTNSFIYNNIDNLKQMFPPLKSKSIQEILNKRIIHYLTLGSKTLPFKIVLFFPHCQELFDNSCLSFLSWWEEGHIFLFFIFLNFNGLIICPNLLTLSLAKRARTSKGKKKIGEDEDPIEIEEDEEEFVPLHLRKKG